MTYIMNKTKLGKKIRLGGQCLGHISIFSFWSLIRKYLLLVDLYLKISRSGGKIPRFEFVKIQL